MCGFVAVINSKENSEKLRKSFFKLKSINNHRGPDDVKIIHKRNYSLLFRRLEIIDLHKRSAQPFTDQTGKIHLLFNGEIYNYLELKNELKSLNINFKTKSDTEVIMQSYKFWGENFVKKLRGMFSIIILDNFKNRFLCFRDRLGQKPLYYSKYKNGLILSSEIKDIIYLKEKNQLNENKKKIIKYLNAGHDSGDETFFENIYSFPSSSMGIIKNNTISIKKYWNLNIHKNKKFNNIKFENIFSDNLKIHLRSDVPIAFTLSGGLDSSTILSKSLENNLKDHKAYSLYSNKDKKFYEKKYIQDFIYKNSVKHAFLNIDSNKNNLIEEFIKIVDEPSISSSFLPQLLLRKKIKKDGFKVLVTGEGGDEAMGGYNRMIFPYLYTLFIKKNKKIPKKIKEKLIQNSSIHIFQQNYFDYKNKLYDKFREDNSASYFLYKKETYKNFYNIKNFDKKNGFKYLLKNHLFERDLPHILKIEDRISMSQSIENRTPLIDHILLEYIFSIDEKYFIFDGESKYMLRTIAKSKLPISFFQKQKVGRPSPITKYIFKDYYEKFSDYLNSNNYKTDYFSNDLIYKEYIKDKINNNFSNVQFYFKVLNLLIWKSEFRI
tara:strand:+ start:5490 stop:7304 length:1815 start_codon:yes stop_codon:yes gene_type:complete